MSTVLSMMPQAESLLAPSAVAVAEHHSSTALGWTLALRVVGAPGGGSTCNGLVATVDLGLGQVPTTGDDVIVGTSGADVVNGLAGADVICGFGGDDVLNGGGGADVIFGGDGADVLGGQGGPDELFGEGGDDRLNGGVGNDCLLYTSPSPRDQRGSRMPSSA